MRKELPDQATTTKILDTQDAHNKFEALQRWHQSNPSKAVKRTSRYSRFKAKLSMLRSLNGPLQRNAAEAGCVLIARAATATSSTIEHRPCKEHVLGERARQRRRRLQLTSTAIAPIIPVWQSCSKPVCTTQCVECLRLTPAESPWRDVYDD